MQESTPKPTIDGVVITPAPKTTSYVRVFGGFATKNTILEEAEALRRDLEKDKVRPSGVNQDILYAQPVWFNII